MSLEHLQRHKDMLVLLPHTHALTHAYMRAPTHTHTHTLHTHIHTHAHTHTQTHHKHMHYRQKGLAE